MNPISFRMFKQYEVAAANTQTQYYGGLMYSTGADTTVAITQKMVIDLDTYQQTNTLIYSRSEDLINWTTINPPYQTLQYSVNNTNKEYPNTQFISFDTSMPDNTNVDQTVTFRYSSSVDATDGSWVSQDYTFNSTPRRMRENIWYENGRFPVTYTTFSMRELKLVDGYGFATAQYANGGLTELYFSSDDGATWNPYLGQAAPDYIYYGSAIPDINLLYGNTGLYGNAEVIGSDIIVEWSPYKNAGPSTRKNTVPGPNYRQSVGSSAVGAESRHSPIIPSHTYETGSHIMMVYGGYKLMISADNGSTWTEELFDDYPVIAGGIVGLGGHNSNMFVIFGDSSVSRSSDAGATWTTTYDELKSFYDVRLSSWKSANYTLQYDSCIKLSDTEWMASWESWGLLKTSDMGATFTMVQNPVSEGILKVYKHPNNVYYVIIGVSRMHYTTNLASTLYTSTNNRFNDVEWDDVNNKWLGYSYIFYEGTGGQIPNTFSMVMGSGQTWNISDTYFKQYFTMNNGTITGAVSPTTDNVVMFDHSTAPITITSFNKAELLALASGPEANEIGGTLTPHSMFFNGTEVVMVSEFLYTLTQAGVQGPSLASIPVPTLQKEYYLEGTLPKNMFSNTVGVTLYNSGSGYDNTTTFTVSAPDDPNGIQAVVDEVLTNNNIVQTGGTIFNIILSCAGSGYTTPVTITATGTGTGFQCTVTPNNLLKGFKILSNGESLSSPFKFKYSVGTSDIHVPSSFIATQTGTVLDNYQGYAASNSNAGISGYIFFNNDTTKVISYAQQDVSYDMNAGYQVQTAINQVRGTLQSADMRREKQYALIDTVAQTITYHDWFDSSFDWGSVNPFLSVSASYEFFDISAFSPLRFVISVISTSIAHHSNGQRTYILTLGEQDSDGVTVTTSYSVNTATFDGTHFTLHDEVKRLSKTYSSYTEMSQDNRNIFIYFIDNSENSPTTPLGNSAIFQINENTWNSSTFTNTNNLVYLKTTDGFATFSEATGFATYPDYVGDPLPLLYNDNEMKYLSYNPASSRDMLISDNLEGPWTVSGTVTNI